MTDFPTPKRGSRSVGVDDAEFEITDDLTDPYFEGAAGIGLLPPNTAQAVLDGRGYLIDRKSGRYRRISENVVGQRDSRSGEAATVQTDVFRRAQESWHLGAGQVFYDRDGSNQYQFQASKGVDPWEKFYLSLLPDTTLLDASGGGYAVVVGPWLVNVNGTLVDWYGTTFSQDMASIFPSPARSVTSDGKRVIVAMANGTVAAMDLNLDVTTIATGAYTVVAYVKGRLLAASGNSVYDLTSGTATLVWQHPDAAWRWNAIGDGLVAVYASGYVGDKSGVYRFRSKDDGTGLDVGIQAAQVPDGEMVRHVGYYLGYSVIGTDKGVRFGSSDAQGSLVLGSLLETPEPVLCSEGQDRFVWFGWSDFDDASTGLGRMDPSKFTDPLTPAYASDLMADGQGDVLSVVTFQGKRVFTVDGVGIYVEADSPVQSGWVTSGFISWNVPDVKRGAYVMLRHGSLPANSEIALDVSYDNGPWKRVGTSGVAGSTMSENLALAGAPFSAVNLRTTLKRGGLAFPGPILTRTEVRASPTAGRASVFQVPLVIAERDEWAGATRTIDVAAEVSHLVELCQSGKPTIYTEGNSSWQVNMIDYEWTPDKQTSDGSSWSGVFLAVLRELK